MAGNLLELSEQTFSVIAELGRHMPGGFFIYKAAAPEELLYVNKPVLDIFGCESEEEFRELTGYTFKGMVHPDDYGRISDSIVEQIRTSEDKMDYAEYRIIRKDGRVRWIDDYGHYALTHEYGPVYTVFISDITEKHERIEAQMASHVSTINALSSSVAKMHAQSITFSRVAQALAGDYFSIYIVDPESEHFIEYSSTEEYELMGVEKEGGAFFETSRRNMSRLLYPEDKDRFMAVFNKDQVMSILKRDGTFTTKYRLLVDGKPTYVSMKATLLEDENGSHLIIGTNNIDAQMKREQQFQEKMTEARNRAKNDFLANMSHDIRTPMNAIVGYSSIALSHLDEPEVVKDSLSKIGSSSHFLLSLINDVLDMSKIESGKMQLAKAPFDLMAVLGRIQDITFWQAQKKSLKISYDYSRVQHGWVEGDELRVEQVLINIVSNAIKYTPEGKSVTLYAEEREGERENEGVFRFVIEDTGIGISEDYLPHIFDSFTREQNTTINKIQGTGLGLAITARIVEMMGGTIQVESEVGVGSAFTVELRLPLIQSPEEEADEEEAVPVDLSSCTILLVDDNDVNAEIAGIILGQAGAKTERAENGQKCLELFKARGEGAFDAVLMDIQMPVMNGYEATAAIRALPGDYARQIPIIAMSANAYDEDVRSCLEAGMNAHVAKPFDPEQLLSLLMKQCRKEALPSEG